MVAFINIPVNLVMVIYPVYLAISLSGDDYKQATQGQFLVEVSVY